MKEKELFTGRRGLMAAAPNEPFVRGPIQREWVCQAAAQPGRSLHVAIALAYQVGLEGSLKVRMTKKLRTLFHLNRHACRRGLDWLAAAGLVVVEHHQGRAPVVIVRLASKDGATQRLANEPLRGGA